MNMMSRHPMAGVEASIPMPADQTDRGGGLSFAAALTCIVLVAIDLRPGIVSMGPVLPEIRSELGVTNAQAAMLTAIPTLLMGLLAIPTPWLARRFGRDRVMLAALFILGAATAARAFVGSLGMLLLTAVGVGAGIAIAGTLIAGFVKSIFPHRAAMLVGVYAMALGLGSTVAAASAGPIAALCGGWRLGSSLFALPGLVAIAAWLVVARTPDRTTVEGDARGPSARAGLPVRNPTAWLVALYFAANNILFFGFLAWIAPIYRERGLTDTAAGLVLASFTAAFMIANPLPGLLGRSEDRRIVIGVFAGFTFAGALGLAVMPFLSPFVLIPMVAFGIGGSFAIGMTLPLDNALSPDEANAWNAFVMAIGYGTGAIGPLAVGVLRDWSGGFLAPLVALSAVAFTKVALAFVLHPHHLKGAKRRPDAVKPHAERRDRRLLEQQGAACDGARLKPPAI